MNDLMSELYFSSMFEHVSCLSHIVYWQFSLWHVYFKKKNQKTWAQKSLKIRIQIIWAISNIIVFGNRVRVSLFTFFYWAWVTAATLLYAECNCGGPKPEGRWYSLGHQAGLLLQMHPSACKCLSCLNRRRCIVTWCSRWVSLLILSSMR